MDANKKELAGVQLGSLTKTFFKWLNSLSLFQKFLMAIVLYVIYQVSDIIPYAFDDMVLTLGYIWYVLSQLDKFEEN